MVRALLVGFSIGMVLASVSCGKTDTSCTAASCAGCCDSAGACQTGQSVNSCGTSGVACLTCSAGEACDGTRCAAPGTSGSDGGGVIGAADGGRVGPDDGGSISLPACNSSNCTGCCDGNVCQLGSSKQSCGAQGGSCVSCSGNDSCVRGTCITLSCNEATCPDGCCDGAVCRSGNGGSACGRGGSACITCGTGLSCQGGVCASEASCSAANCSSGCCKAGTCFTGAASEACGIGGQSCQICDSSSTCSNRTCTVKPCGPATCGGCCTASGQCSTGTTTGACGLGGARCDVCSSAETCSASGECVVRPSQCDSTTCAGCCFNGVCEDGQSGTACGAGGMTCSVCVFGCSASGSCLSPAVSDGGLPSGAPCNSNDECRGDPLFKLGICENALLLDGGANGYPGGYCTSFCLSDFSTCGDHSVCVEQRCLATCSGAGQGSCRSGYVCDGQTGGNVCVPNCKNAGYDCPSSRPSCNASGFCR